MKQSTNVKHHFANIYHETKERRKQTTRGIFITTRKKRQKLAAIPSSWYEKKKQYNLEKINVTLQKNEGHLNRKQHEKWKRKMEKVINDINNNAAVVYKNSWFFTTSKNRKRNKCYDKQQTTSGLIKVNTQTDDKIISNQRT